MQSPIIRDKAIKTSLNRYGVDYPMQSQIIRASADATV